MAFANQLALCIAPTQARVGAAAIHTQVPARACGAGLALEMADLNLHRCHSNTSSPHRQLVFDWTFLVVPNSGARGQYRARWCS